ncbi:TadE/TadG family type IV pilus assembly protein [Agrobacterium tumefaciens]|uniref:vWA domain-containing protein n=1 Tax=Agrobacterium tumefaciens TaxID=358 RepID=UPI00287CB062|nr:TadE/TadG family type IV pilus assembly protein [Agrobacterium tumefaciens]MDS7594568.1 VWA domain-containing protein [Agrobacterium tumefaciens]
MTLPSETSLKRRFLADTTGNFGIMTAILLPVLLGAAGAGMELANVMQVKADLQNTADAGALAAVTHARLKEGKASDDEIKETARKFIIGQMENELTKEEQEELDKNSTIGLTTRDDARGKTFIINTTIRQSVKLNPLLGFLGIATINISATGTAQASVNKGAPLSMYLVLDRSGSMSFKTDTINTTKKSCANYTKDNWGQTEKQATSSPCYVNKMDSLKTAVSFLVTTLNKADPTYTTSGSELVRTGAIAYEAKAFTPQAMIWGTGSVNTYVNQIPQFPTGGTDATAALTKAYDALKKSNPEEAKQHKAKGSESFERYIVLMTDGEMTGSSASWNSSYDQSVRNVCATAKADGIKIFSVAFMAPDKGKSLLQYCASSLDNYYAPEDMNGIVTAFGEIARKASGSIATLTN